MTNSLQNIFDLEDNEQFEDAFEAYTQLYLENKTDYEVWKHFYFFLWIAIEDAPGAFNEKINLRKLLGEMLTAGIKLFSDKTDFNFIAGYTVSIFPYEYGDYNGFEKLGQQMLLKAKSMDPNNLIYKMVALGSFADVNKKEYNKIITEAAPVVLQTYNGKGALNKYFKEVLYRIDKPTVEYRG